KKSGAIPSRSFIKTRRPCDNYVNFDDYTEQNFTKATEVTLRVEINKDISLYDEPVVNKEKNSDCFYKIGRTKNIKYHLEQWQKKYNYKVELVKALPESKKCKYTHCMERLIYLELE
ncbi:23683_t:CDS:2, partial [Dentiscutata erythropus]